MGVAKIKVMDTREIANPICLVSIVNKSPIVPTNVGKPPSYRVTQVMTTHVPPLLSTPIVEPLIPSPTIIISREEYD